MWCDVVEHTWNYKQHEVKRLFKVTLIKGVYFYGLVNLKSNKNWLISYLLSFVLKFLMHFICFSGLHYSLFLVSVGCKIKKSSLVIVQLKRLTKSFVKLPGNWLCIMVFCRLFAHLSPPTVPWVLFHLMDVWRELCWPKVCHVKGDTTVAEGSLLIHHPLPRDRTTLKHVLFLATTKEQRSQSKDAAPQGFVSQLAGMEYYELQFSQVA